MFREDPLLKVGVVMMALALALVIAAIVVSVTLRSEPGRVVASEVATTKSPGEPPRFSSGEEESATKKSSSSEKEPPPYYPSEEESLGYGSSSSSGEQVVQREEEAKEKPQAVGGQEAEPPKSQFAKPQAAGQQAPSEAPSEPEPQPQQRQPQPQEQLLPGELWDRLENEPERAFRAFETYRNLPSRERTLIAAYRLHVGNPDAAKPSDTWSRWSSEFAWRERAAAYDAHIDRLREKSMEEVIQQQAEEQALGRGE